MIERVPHRLRRRYREQPAFDVGERQEKIARARLWPHGNVDHVTSARTVSAAGRVTREEPLMRSTIPPGARVRSPDLGRWVGTITEVHMDREGNVDSFGYRVAWDNGVVEASSGEDLEVLSVPGDPDQAFDAAVGQGRR